MSVRLEITQLRHFLPRVKAEIIRPMRRRNASDEDTIGALVGFGNAFLDEARENPVYRDAVIWFDINLGDPAHVGFTWAYNPFAPIDWRFNADYFWRCWSEVAPDRATVLSLAQNQEEFTAYCFQHTNK